MFAQAAGVAIFDAEILRPGHRRQEFGSDQIVTDFRAQFARALAPRSSGLGRWTRDAASSVSATTAENA